jgi:O-antigen/teichoic acid export membrane protein
MNGIVARVKEKIVRLLRWSERYVKTDMVYAASGGIWLSVGRFVSSLAAFVLSIAFANLFPKDAYGVYRYVLSIVGVIGSFALTGMPTAVTQSVARGFDGTFRDGFKTTLRWTIVTTVIAFGTAVYYFMHSNSEIAWALVIAGVCLPVLKSANLFDAFLTGKKDFTRKTTYGFAYDGIPILILVVALFFTHSALVMLCVYFVSYAAISLLLYKKTLSVYAPANEVDPGARKYAVHLSIMNVFGGVSSQIDRIFVFHFLGAVQVAVYSFALALPNQIRQLQKIVATLVLPRFSGHSLPSIAATIWHKARVMFFTMAALSAAYMLAAPYLFRLFFPQYVASIFFSQVFSLVLLTAPVALFKQALTAHTQTKALYISQVAMPIFKILLLFILIPLYGIMGAIIGYICGEIVNFFLSMFLFYRSLSKEKPINFSGDML